MTLDTAALGEAFARSGKKQWLLAQQLGVHPRTLSRWLLGRVNSVEAETLDRLAQALDSPPASFMVANAAPSSTAGARQTAARAVGESDLLALLSPSGDWALAEKLALALLEPGLSSAQRGRLLNILSIACWRQGRFGVSRRYAEDALVAGQAGRARGVIAKARFNLATLDSFQGRFAAAVEQFELCVRLPRAFEKERDLGSALANLSMAYRDVARLDDALAAQDRAEAIFRSLRAQFNQAISCAQYFVILSEMGRFKEALRQAQRGQAIGLRIGDSFKPNQMAICQADCLALLGEPASALEMLRPALPWLPTGGRADPELHIAASRVLRLASRPAEAQGLLEAGWADARKLPLARGLWLMERARLALAITEVEAETHWRRKANRVFRNHGLLRRIRRTRVAEQGAMFVAEAAPKPLRRGR